MMQLKLCFVLLVLLTIVIESTSYNGFNRKGNSIFNRKNYNDERDNIETYKHNYAEVDYPQQSPYRRHRYPPYGSSSNNYPSRSRWPSPYEDLLDSNDYSRYGFGLNGPLSNFPGPLPPAFDNNPFLNNGPTCYSLLDPQYPLFSDVCGAVPQARYALPNSFGHFERWQIAQILTTILGPGTPASSNPVCTRSLRLLLCPLLFPPCPTRYEAPPVLPCQPFCRVIKNQCASPSLDLLPCDLLPPTSELCPINPAPYSSLLSSFPRPLPFNGGLSPSSLPPSALSSLLAQSALSALTAFDVPPTALPQSVPPPPPLTAQPAFNVPPSTLPQSPFSFLPPQSAPSSFNVAPLGFPSAPAPSGVSPFSFSSLMPSPGLPPSAAVPPSAMSPRFNPLLNMESYMADSLTPILVDFPPLVYTNEHRQVPPYFPLTRSATEKV